MIPVLWGMVMKIWLSDVSFSWEAKTAATAGASYSILTASTVVSVFSLSLGVQRLCSSSAEFTPQPGLQFVYPTARLSSGLLTLRLVSLSELLGNSWLMQPHAFGELRLCEKLSDSSIWIPHGKPAIWGVVLNQDFFTQPSCTLYSQAMSFLFWNLLSSSSDFL